MSSQLICITFFRASKLVIPRRSYGKIEGCEQASPRVDSKFFSSVKCEVKFSAPTTGTRNVKRDGL